MDSEKACEILGKISELLKSLDCGVAQPDTSSSPFIACTIKALPARLAAKASTTAIKINPTNNISFQIAGIVDNVVKPTRLTLLVSKYWGPTDRQLTVSFMDNPSLELRRRILSHMNAWTKTGCISFVETARGGQVRISRGPGGYWSYLGTDILHIPRNRPTMNLEGFTMQTPESEFLRVVRHETGHSLAYPHEHMRSQLIARLDIQKTYEYFRQYQGWDEATVDAQVLTPLEEVSIRGTPTADEDSIMCYQLPGEITKDGLPIRGGNDINDLDYEFCGKIYPKQDTHKPTCDCSADSSNAVIASTDTWNESEDIEAFA